MRHINQAEADALRFVMVSSAGALRDRIQAGDPKLTAESHEVWTSALARTERTLARLEGQK